MSGPRNSFTAEDGKRLYTHPARKISVPSVTTVISGGIAKPALTYWAANEAANFAIDMRHAWLPLLEADDDGSGRDAAYDLIKKSPWRKRDTAGARGSAVHAAAEAVTLGVEPTVTTEVGTFLDGFKRFLDDFQPEYEAAEITVWNLTRRYAGTLDGIAVIDGIRWLLDVKTGKGIYPDFSIQLAAYRHAEFLLGPDHVTEFPMPEVDACAILHLRPEGYDGGTPKGYRFVPVEAGPESFRAFLHARGLYDWQLSLAKTCIGEPLTPDRRELISRTATAFSDATENWKG